MDFEMGFIDGFEDVMQMETKVLQNIYGGVEGGLRAAAGRAACVCPAG